MKFNNPDKVTLLLLSSSLLEDSLEGFSFSSSFNFSSFFFLCPVKSSEQSISSITIIDLLVVSIKSFLSSVLFFTAVSSKS
ncbi:hypothetical protein IC582_029777 [Cucumis melo]